MLVPLGQIPDHFLTGSSISQQWPVATIKYIGLDGFVRHGHYNWAVH